MRMNPTAVKESWNEIEKRAGGKSVKITMPARAIVDKGSGCFPQTRASSTTLTINTAR